MTSGYYSPSIGKWIYFLDEEAQEEAKRISEEAKRFQTQKKIIDTKAVTEIIDGEEKIVYKDAGDIDWFS